MWIVGNWKMHGQIGTWSDEMQVLSEQLVGLQREDHAVSVILCPPYPYLGYAAAQASPGKWWAYGSQDISPCVEDGAYTGEVSGRMLRDCGAQFVLVGHSERRLLFLENDALLVRKLHAAWAAGLAPIWCMGESQKAREAGETLSVIAAQLQVFEAAWESYTNRQSTVPHAFFAYEPLWAIGSGLVPTVSEIQGVHAHIRQRFCASIPILYGGSVTPANASEIFTVPDVDGVLVGGASRRMLDFSHIVQSADTALRRRIPVF